MQWLSASQGLLQLARLLAGCWTRGRLVTSTPVSALGREAACSQLSRRSRESMMQPTATLAASALSASSSFGTSFENARSRIASIA
jgi:hypothetical protein